MLVPINGSGYLASLESERVRLHLVAKKQGGSEKKSNFLRHFPILIIRFP